MSPYLTDLSSFSWRDASFVLVLVLVLGLETMMWIWRQTRGQELKSPCPVGTL